MGHDLPCLGQKKQHLYIMFRALRCLGSSMMPSSTVRRCSFAGRCLALEAGQEQGDSDLQAAPLCRPRQRTTATDLTVAGVAGGQAGAHSPAGATLF